MKSVIRTISKVPEKHFMAVGFASALAFLSAGVQADRSDDVEIFIKPQATDAALLQLARETGVQIMFSPELAENTRSPMVEGTMTITQAMDRLLSGTGLTYDYGSDNVLVVRKEEEAGSTRALEGRDKEIEEIIVTATKRDTSLQDTAMAISVLGADTIDKRGLVSMGDYLSTIPGVTMQDRGAGAKSITMRGISVSPQTERTAVGVYFGETLVSGENIAVSSGSGDLRMVDVDRVEVLKGPQGTLYGADSMGGIVRILPNRPNLEQFEAEVGAQYSNTSEYGNNNYQMQGILNVPLVEDQLALRVVIYRHENSGFVDNIAGSYQGDGSVTLDLVEQYGGLIKDEGDRGSNEVNGVRLATRWQPVEQLDINLSYAWQEVEQDGWQETELSLPGSYHQARVQPTPTVGPTLNGVGSETESLATEVRLTSLTLDYDLGWGTLHSSSNWSEWQGKSFYDWTAYVPVFPYYIITDNESDRFTQEVRFASQFKGPFQLLGGVYYDDHESHYYLSENYVGDLENAGAANLVWDVWPGHENDPYHFMHHAKGTVEQKAVFGEISYDILESLTASVGVRRYQYDQTSFAEQAGNWRHSETPVVRTDLEGEQKGETYKANLSWKPNSDTLIYAQWAEGFRLGSNQGPKLEEWGCDIDGNGKYELAGGGEVPITNGTLEPDSTENYELGVKSSFLDHRVTVNAAIYHINWEGLPVRLNLAAGGACGAYFANAGESTSEGVELESRLLLTEALSLDLSASYNEAKLKGDSPMGNDGDDLPGSADFNFNAGLEYAFQLTGRDAFVRADYAYVGEYEAKLNQSDSVPASGDYSQIHLKAGMTMENLAIDLFVNNLTNADDITWTDFFSAGRGRTFAYRLRPRTIGFDISYRF